ncbi:S-layer homology domain-containing protein [Sporosarcina sp. A2]|uniref:S-layer homology domain-containing protein n=1 Tax=Sporosarcina sp. A2 TaxID=3393449 RepID=UPI003D7BFAD4
MKKFVNVLLALVLSLAIIVIPTGSAEAAGFSDVSSFKKEIDYLTQSGVINGYNDGTFRPAVKLTRAQAVVMIMRAIGMPESDRFIKDPGFDDVGRSKFGYLEIAVATSAGIISGKSSTQFDPNGNITRAEMAKVIGNAFKLKGVYATGFTDVAAGYWASSFISSLAANNITVGYSDGTFQPKQPIDRAQFSAFLARIMKPIFRPSTGIPSHTVLDVTLESSIIDVVKDPNQPVVYYLDSKSKSLVRLNIATGDKNVIGLKHPAEKLVEKNGKLFVSQLIQDRSSYNFMETQKGIINVYAADDLALIKEVSVNIDPYDIAVDDQETLIISSGSGQGYTSEIQTYNWQTSEMLSFVKVPTQQLIELSPAQNRLYSIETSHYTGRIQTFSFTEGKLESAPTDPRYFDTSKLRGYTQMTPGGKVMYNGDGTVYGLSTIPSEDLAPLGKLATPFTTMTFNEAAKKFYLADRAETISVYDNDTLDPSASLHTYGKVDRLVYVEESGELYAITKFKFLEDVVETVLLERFKIGK